MLLFWLETFASNRLCLHFATEFCLGVKVLEREKSYCKSLWPVNMPVSVLTQKGQWAGSKGSLFCWHVLPAAVPAVTATTRK